MDNLRILLCCGAGFSSGLLAQKGRKYIQKSKLSITIDARSESQVGGYLECTDVLFLGPHYANELEAFKVMAEPHGIIVDVIPKDIYGMIDGQRLVELAIKLVEEKNNYNLGG